MGFFDRLLKACRLSSSHFIGLSFIFFALLLTSCQTSTTPEQAKKITAAKINDRLGMAYLERHDIQRAKQKFLLALEEAPSIPETWYSMAYFLESTGNKEEARRYYEKAVAIDPKRGDVLNNYGTFLCRRGNYPLAVSHFIKATKDPKYLEQASAFENAGLCSLKMADFRHAMTYFKRALEEDPNRTTSLIELAELNFRQGDYPQARRQLNQYLMLVEPSTQSYQLEKKLDEKMSA